MKRMSFDTESILGIQAGRKWETTRVVKPQPELRADGMWGRGKGAAEIPMNECGLRCRLLLFSRYHVGDIVAVTETWAPANDNANSIVFKADGLLHAPPMYFAAEERDVPCYWKSARFMPADLSRITIEITSVAACRVQDLTYAQVLAEGWDPRTSQPMTTGTAGEDAQLWWQRRWTGIYPDSSPYCYDLNPWARRFGFKVLEVRQ